jgi:alpha-L-rhamnosidase
MSQSHQEELRPNFVVPPDSARPRVWWHWMNGNVSKEGIKLDLEWMHRIGLGGLQTFDAAYDTPDVVDPRLVFMTPPWKDAFLASAQQANQLGLELAIAGAPGWSESGGPWVKPEQGMKKLVWAETRVNGGVPFSGVLPRPPAIVGPFQDAPVVRGPGSIGGPAPVKPIPGLYKDVAVVAYRLPDDDLSMGELRPVVTSSFGAVDGSALWDGSYIGAVHLPFSGPSGRPWLQIDFGHPQIVQSMSVGLLNNGSVLGPRHIGAELESSTDGREFQRITAAYDTADYPFQSAPPVQETVSFSPVTARYFRLLLLPAPMPRLPQGMENLEGTAPTEQGVTEFVLHTTPRVNHFEQKAGFFLDSGMDSHPTIGVAAREIVDPTEVIDLTDRLRTNGTLEWTPPPGRWAILRFGYSLLGITNHPASPEGTGLEVDKLNRAAVKSYMDAYLGLYESILGSNLIGLHGLRAMVSDSWEAGPQNWTDELPLEFYRRRGYDLHPWLPALTGRIIRNAAATDQFLWDFRRTLADLLIESHYGQIAASLHTRGMTYYGESHEISRAFIGDGMDAKRGDDIPMGAMWVPSPFVRQEQCDADIRESASVAHLYGQNIVAGESMTALGLPHGAYAFSPDTLKPTADRELADGLNLFVVHTSVHQPLVDQPPGLTLGPFGQWFSRHDTWAEQATPWVTYLSRSSYLLQQGHFVADIVYYYGQDSNITALFANHLPAIPEGYAFDFASAHALTQLSVLNGDLVTASGMRYRLLALDPRARVMSLDVLRTIAGLVEAGATVVGEKPLRTPSYADNAEEFRDLSDSVWGPKPGRHAFGKGWVLNGRPLTDLVSDIKLEPDFSYGKPETDAAVWFVHRRLEDSDLYFVNNRQPRNERIEARFRVRGRVPEVWHADTGIIERVSYRQQSGRTMVTLKLDPYDAVFVVFRDSTRVLERNIAQFVREPVGTMTGPWDVSFQSGRGAPNHVAFTDLSSWTKNRNPGIRYFSGTASYTASLKAPESWFNHGQHIEIDLGEVRNLAEVDVGGRPAGIAWKWPFRLDLTDLLKPGINAITVRVTNLWPNRLIGDKQQNATPIAFTTFDPYRADSPLLESGLLGPITILRVKAPVMQ